MTRERIPGGYMTTGECGRPHLKGPAWSWWRCQPCRDIANAAPQLRNREEYPMPEVDVPLFHYLDPWDHGPIYLRVRGLIQAWCTRCGWMGPDRTSDTHASDLVLDDACHHAHHMFALCGVCEECRAVKL